VLPVLGEIPPKRSFRQARFLADLGFNLGGLGTVKPLGKERRQ
jgi:hypothetical protein